MARLNNLSPLTVVFVIAALTSGLAHAQRADDEIYKSAVKVILGKNKFSTPAEFVIWDKTISSAAITTGRLPRQDPDKQFQRALPGLSAILENKLISINSGMNDRGMVALKFDHPATPFSGFVNRTSIKQDELQNKNSMTVIGFSKIAYDENGRDALLYAEECSPGTDDYCSGDSFWFTHSDGKWHLKKYVGLWGGPVKPFWDFE